jgi:hypothetical protein
VPTYYEVIKNPMSFMRMREKQKADMYTSLDSLLVPHFSLSLSLSL